MLRPLCFVLTATSCAAVPTPPLEQSSGGANTTDSPTRTPGRRLGFRGIKRFFTTKQEHQQLHGAVPAHATHYRGRDVSSESESWWADKHGNFHGQAGQDKTVVALFENMPPSHRGRRFFVDLAANHERVSVQVAR